jgi:Ras-related protein Rab-1A/Rab family protein
VSEKKPYKWKVCLLGESTVGKTSLIKRFVYNQFDDSYSNTIGANVTKKELTVKHPDNGSDLDAYLMIWDLMGQQCFLHMLRQSYFFGAQGLIAVCDITKKDTLNELEGWLSQGLGITGPIPIIILGNKYDLENKAFDLPDLENFAAKYEKAVPLLSSVKTGFNVEKAFEMLCKNMLKHTME